MNRRSILDARLGFTITKGFAVNFLFTIDERLQKYAKMIFPGSLELREKIEEMERISDQIGLNVQFQ